MSGTGEIVKKVRAALERKRRINLHRCPVQIEFQDGVLTPGVVPADQDEARIERFQLTGVSSTQC